MFAFIAATKAGELTCESIYGGTQSDLEALQKAKDQMNGKNEINISEE